VPMEVSGALGVWDAVAGELRGVGEPAAPARRPPESRSLIQMLAEHLRSRRVLVVLDNCEHVVAACAELCDALLRACPGVRILATSREPLNVPGETTYRLPSLSVPDPEEWSILQYEAVRLFVDRAVAVLPSFAVS